MAYHFVICNGTNGCADGKVEVGLRWLRQIRGGHVKSETYNANSIGICVVGNFQEGWVTRRQEASLVALIDYLKNTVLKGGHAFGCTGSWSRPFVRVKISPRRNYTGFSGDASLG